MGIIIATLIVVVAIASALAQDFAIFSWAYWQEGDTSTSRSEVFRNVGLFFVAVIALGFGIWRAWTAHRQAEASQRQAEAANEQARAANEQARIAQQGQITDRFSTAVEHLGSEQLPVRLGGIYALWRLIKDSPDSDVISVIDILCAFVRYPPHDMEMAPAHVLGGKAGQDSVLKVRPDLQTILDLISPESARYRRRLPSEYKLDLRFAALNSASLRHAHLEGARLFGVSLKVAYLVDANLKSANIGRANLRAAICSRANFENASLWRTVLINADFDDASFMHAELERANLMGANLTGANLTDANLTDANLTDANLTGANLRVANFTGANLTGANLTDATNLTQQQLDVARYDPDNPPELPPGLVLPEPPPEPEAESTPPPTPEA